jgi:DNA/RNA non-specific endonuclease
MTIYANLDALTRRVVNGTVPGAWNGVVRYLTDAWLDHYARTSPSTDVVQTSAGNFSYLFDIASERLIAAWGVSQGRHAGARDSSRMAGHPLSAGALYHRGHAIPHTLGGPTDINLVPQLGAVNIGKFRPLERQAVATPGSLYFTYWRYALRRTQTPSGVDQGLLVPGHGADVRKHGN